MDYFYKLNVLAILSFTVIFSNDVFADTYPAQVNFYFFTDAKGQSVHDSSADLACRHISADWSYSGAAQPPASSGTCTNSKTGQSNAHAYIVLLPSSCPNGGTLSGTSCTNAPSCILPEVRSVFEPYACFTPPSCTYPEVYKEITSSCEVPECATSQLYNYITNSCLVTPQCAATEHLKETSAGFVCELNKLNCPEHSHASSHNDLCRPDAPLTCELGMHDDGTYTCVANDPVGCKSGYTHGYVDGVPTCAKMTDPTKKNKTTDDAKDAYDSAVAALAGKKLIADAAAAAAADPTNTTKVDAAAANAELLAAQKDLDAKLDTLKNEYAADDNANLKSLEQNIKQINERGIALEKGEGMGFCF